MSTDKDIKESWEYQIAKIQHDINNPSSILQGKIITKIDFWVENRKHVWRKTIEKMPNPLDPSKTVGDTMYIYKNKNHVRLVPKGTFKVGEKNV